MNKNRKKRGSQEEKTTKIIILATAIIQFINTLLSLINKIADMMN